MTNDTAVIDNEALDSIDPHGEDRPRMVSVGGKSRMAVINIRECSVETREKFKVRAHLRNLNLAEYLAKLISMHDRFRVLADNGNKQIAKELRELGLQSLRG